MDDGGTYSLVNFKSLKVAIIGVSFISISYDQMISIDNQQWLLVHLYVLDNWVCTLLLLSMAKVINGSNVENIIKFVVQSLLQERSLGQTNIATKLVAFGLDGVNVFQGATSNVTKQIEETCTPFSLGMHCVSHMTKLVM
jgi:hypothetical protein